MSIQPPVSAKPIVIASGHGVDLPRRGVRTAAWMLKRTPKIVQIPAKIPHQYQPRDQMLG
jgi:hypothetical protein